MSIDRVPPVARVHPLAQRTIQVGEVRVRERVRRVQSVRVRCVEVIVLPEVPLERTRTEVVDPTLDVRRSERAEEATSQVLYLQPTLPDPGPS